MIDAYCIALLAIRELCRYEAAVPLSGLLLPDFFTFYANIDLSCPLHHLEAGLSLMAHHRVHCHNAARRHRLCDHLVEGRKPYRLRDYYYDALYSLLAWYNSNEPDAFHEGFADVEKSVRKRNASE